MVDANFLVNFELWKVGINISVLCCLDGPGALENAGLLLFDILKESSKVALRVLVDGGHLVEELGLFRRTFSDGNLGDPSKLLELKLRFRLDFLGRRVFNQIWTLDL